MSIAATLQKHLSSKHIVYDVVSLSLTMRSVLSAEACCVSPDRVAKGVVVRRYVLPVLPASRRISRTELKMELGENFALASENELEQLFEHCVPGAVPRSAKLTGSTPSSSRVSAISRTSISRVETTRLSST